MGIESRNRVQAGFSLSSMTDIVFLLLIFFIVVSTLVTTNSLEMLLPKKQTTAPKMQPPLVEVSITADNQLFIDNKQIGQAQAETALMAAMGGEVKNGIVLKSDPEATTEAVVLIMDIAQRNQFPIVLTSEKQ